MMKTTQDTRDTARELTERYKDGGVLDHKLVLEILDDADRCAELEAALHKVDEIRHDVKSKPLNYSAGAIGDRLKAPCMEVYK